MSTRGSAPSREERTRDDRRDRGRDRPVRDSGRDTPNERGGRSNRSRSPRRERGGRRSENRSNYRSRSPVARSDRERDGDSGRAGRGDRNGREDRSRTEFRGRDPPTGPRGGGGRSADYRPGGPVKAPMAPKEEVKVEGEEVKDVKMEDQSDRPADMDDETWDMYKCMGFAGFKSTKDTKVPGNDKNFGIRKEKELKARQYMNRQGGFNRPLSPSRDA